MSGEEKILFEGANSARNVLDRTFPDHWIGRGAQICWPARSPDLTPLDFFLWGHLKNKVYNDVPTTAANMRQRVLHECRSITVEQLKNVQQEFIYRLQKCIQVHGAHFENLLK
ncbi:hypothetical protein WH47_12184 [Habropoda laboriosa]|uniref:Transposable element Tc3 transposase n=1 Tax=Habropoda laboriosa TaxID=597456 RepID=A0A0L7RAI4_9HYME|nr:hypothetical protein WH47_12184 [Habropoda laboriosa]